MTNLETIRVERQGRVGWIHLDRPEALNALTGPLLAELLATFRSIARDRSIRAVVLTGAGRAFCAGQDLKERLAPDAPPLAVVVRERYNPIIAAMRGLDQPIVAAVNGVAAGAGAVLALAADFRLVAESAKFSFLFTKVGLAGADMGAAYLLPRLVGLGRATELLILGGEVDAASAVEIGLATRVVRHEDLAASAEELARQLADGPTLAYATTKVLLTRELDLDLGGAIEMEALAQALLMKGEDFREFYAAWSEGRK